jgi:uridine kinase
MTNHTKIVAVSGVSGAGKTSVVKKLANVFNAPFLLFDEHVDKNSYPKNMKVWLKNGANVSLIRTPSFTQSLTNLITQNQFVFIEEPFGRERQSMAPLIDYVILLDPPMELCLARILRRHTKGEGSIESISNYLDKYEDHLRDIYKLTIDQVRNNADLVCENADSINETTHFITDWINSKAD